jgi:hypothetical protein
MGGGQWVSANQRSGVQEVLTKVRPKTSVFAGGGTLGWSVLSMVSRAGCEGQSEQSMIVLGQLETRTSMSGDEVSSPVIGSRTTSCAYLRTVTRARS